MFGDSGGGLCDVDDRYTCLCLGTVGVVYVMLMTGKLSCVWGQWGALCDVDDR